MSEIVNGLWISGSLSPLELLTIQSFTEFGYIFHLWTYEPDSINAPEHCIVKDAATLLPYHQVFTYQHTNKHGHGKGSYAGFSDIFRYKLLYEHGGIWADMDICCLDYIDNTNEYLFRYHHKTGAVGNFMKCPKGSAIMFWCYEQAQLQVTASNLDWMLPISILNQGIERFQLQQYITDLSNKDSFPEVALLLSTSKEIPRHWKLIHWMNEEFRRLNLQKNACLEHSVLGIQIKKHRINTIYLSGSERLKYLLKLSRINYLLRNIQSTLRWYMSISYTNIKDYTFNR